MTIHQFLDGVIYSGSIAGALAALGILGHYVIVRPLRALVEDQITAHLVEIKDVLESQASGLAELDTRLQEHVRNH